MITRSLHDSVTKDLAKKMVFLAGPRQSGKTTFTKSLLKEISGTYYNFDFDADRKKIISSELSPDSQLWILDEIHKYSRWRNWLKGLFDHYHEEKKILVTGSAKLDVYHRGGDSLQGRYFLFRFHPFTLGEMLGNVKTWKTPTLMIDRFFSGEIAREKEHAQSSLQSLLQLGGFPEPLWSGSEVEAQRWRSSYAQRVIQEEIRSLETVKDLTLLELLHQRLPETISSPLSINSLREDLEVSFESVKRWLEIFDRMYLSYRISPFGPARIKAVKKEPKLYLWDWGTIESPGARFENLVASHLLRFVHWCQDLYGEDVELRYFRNVHQQEVDFIILRKKKPWLCVEAKLTAQAIDPNLKYFLERVKTPYAFQIHLQGDKDFLANTVPGTQIRCLPAAEFLKRLP